jgi:hypothetical protein
MTDQELAPVVADEAPKTPEAEQKPTEVAEVTPEPAQETEESREAKRQAKLDRRFANMTRKLYEARAELEAERRYRNQPQPAEEAVTDVDEIVERKLAEREAQSRQKALEAKRETIFAKAEKDAGFDREDFLESTPVTSVMAEAILESDLADKIVKHLYSNQEEAERISNLSPARQAVEIGKLEVKLSSPAPVKKSGAPAPITPIAAKTASLNDYRDDMSDAEFAKWRREQSKRK